MVTSYEHYYLTALLQGSSDMDTSSLISTKIVWADIIPTVTSITMAFIPPDKNSTP